MLGQEKKSRQSYPRQLKRQIAEEVVSGLKGPSEASRDYGIHKDIIGKWVRKYRNLILVKETKEILPLDSMKKKKDNIETDLEQKVKVLEEENMLLRKELHHSNLKAEALSTMIDLAERTYGIGVRKNSGAKQSKK
jgi:transposase